MKFPRQNFGVLPHANRAPELLDEKAINSTGQSSLKPKNT